MTIEKVKLDDNLKPIKPQFNYDVFLGLTTLVLLIFGYLAIWNNDIYIKIFLTILLTQVILIGAKKR